MKKLWHKPRYPRARSVIIAFETLKQTIPTDAELTSAWRKSEAGTPNLRVQGITDERPWIVDLYCGHYYRAVVDGDTGQIWRSLPSLVGYLRHRLGLGPITAAETPSEY